MTHTFKINWKGRSKHGKIMLSLNNMLNDDTSSTRSQFISWVDIDLVYIENSVPTPERLNENTMLNVCGIWFIYQWF